MNFIKNKFIHTALLLCLMGLSIPVYADEESYPLDTVIWQDLNIPVCWEVDKADDIIMKLQNAMRSGWVREAVKDTWEKNSQLVFSGWGKCTDQDNNGIRISFLKDINKKDGAHTKGLGTDLKGKKNGMGLNLIMKKWNSGCVFKYGIESCVKTVAIHEFGHALGFAHEQNRNDRPSMCSEKKQQGTNGNAIFTDWDLNSVMNYCRPDYIATELSPIDTLTVKTYYGRITNYIDDTRKIEIPVVKTEDSTYSVSLSDPDGDSWWKVDKWELTTKKSSKTATFEEDTQILTIPLAKVIDKNGHVSSLYAAFIRRRDNGEYKIVATHKVQPVPEEIKQTNSE